MFDTNLSDDEIERLALLAEEASEVIQIVNKILRHGYDSYNPLTGDVNKNLLEKELGHLSVAIDLMLCNDDINEHTTNEYYSKKAEELDKWLHFNEVPEIMK